MKKLFTILASVLLVAVLTVAVVAAEPVDIHWSFEEGTLEPFATASDWGDIRLILDRDTDRNDGVTPMDKDGKYYLCTVFYEDQENFNEAPTGEIRSPYFYIYDPVITLSIAGGGENYVAICSAEDDSELAVGTNILGSGHPLVPTEINLGDKYTEGQLVYIKIVDCTTSNWGFITVDDIRCKGIIAEDIPIKFPEVVEPEQEEAPTFPKKEYAPADGTPTEIQWSFEEGVLEPFATVSDWGDIRLILDRDTDRNDGTTPMDKDGKYFLCTVFFENQEDYDESYMGEIRSPYFYIYDPLVSVLIAGGGENYVAVCSAEDDSELAVGTNILGSGHPFVPTEIDLGDNYQEGQLVYIKIVDCTTAGWGFISVDDIRCTGIIATEIAAEAPVETEPVETEPVETEPVETEPVETEPVETEPVETEPVETEPVETEPVETEPVVEDPEIIATAESAVEPQTEAPQTFDYGVIAAISSIIAAAGFAVSRKK